jgi:hypothetical protein
MYPPKHCCSSKVNPSGENYYSRRAGEIYQGRKILLAARLDSDKI